MGRSPASLEKGWKGERLVLCPLSWVGQTRCHGHEMLAQCPAVGQDLLWLELTATREILNGNFKWKSAVCETPSGKQSAEGAGGEAPCAALLAPAAALENRLGNSRSCELVQDSSGDLQKGQVKMIAPPFP